MSRKILEDLNRIKTTNGLSMLNRMSPKLYTNKCKGDIISANLKKGFDDMSVNRNAPCVCGSGKKQKRCHFDLKDNGLLTFLWKKYKAFDFEVYRLQKELNIKPFCADGNCNKCCSDYFYVSASEYYLIKNHILTTFGVDFFDKIVAKSIAYLEQFRVEHNEEYEKLEAPTANRKKMVDDRENLKTFLPCPLLDDNGLCSCYNARPLICRFLGTSYLYSACDIIDEKITAMGLNNTDVMVEIAYDESYEENIDSFATKTGIIKLSRPYPLFCYFANDTFYEPRYKLAISQSISVYADKC